MSRTSLLLLLALLFLGFLFLAPHVVNAANGVCVASPASGPVGTVFKLTASGFDPHANVWLYAVEPGGAAFSDPLFGGFGGGDRADKDGVVTFSFNTRFETFGRVIARALGQWTLVAEQRGANSVILHQANCIVQVGGIDPNLHGGLIAVTPAVAPLGSELVVMGSGFAPNEIVNLWLTPPTGCTGFGYELDGFLYLYTGASAHSQANVKTDAKGVFVYVLPTFSYLNCPAFWLVSAYAPGSHIGGIGAYQLVGGTVGSGAFLTVTPSSAFIRGSRLSFSGMGFSANGNVSCWETRPDSSTRPIATFKADSKGNLAFDITTGLDDRFFGVSYSEGGPGLYTMTCRDMATGATALTSYILTGMVTDP